MSSETITVYIDPTQLVVQKQNNYNLFLAKKVNGEFTVIWQSFLPVATTGHPSYEYKNVFQIEIPSYEVNYGTVTQSDGSVTFDASGLAQTIEVGQTVDLDKNGLFGTPSNTGTAGEITINNSLANNPHVQLLDNNGNPLFVNVKSGMDIGQTTLTPIDTYQIWFDNHQDTGTIIVDQSSNVKVVEFSGGTSNQVISYNENGEWQDGPLNSTLAIPEIGLVGGKAGVLAVTVLTTFSQMLTVGAVTYLLSKFMDKFSNNLRPTQIKVDAKQWSVEITFENAKNREILSIFGMDIYESAVNNALIAAKKDPSSGLGNETWTLSEPSVTASYDWAA